ncbi:MAG: GIY-YIG nuclease family protein [Pseudomonadota bacterium]
MQFWVYILRCADGSYYAGHSDNLEARYWQHQQGLCCDWTSRRRPVELAWCQSAPTREEAMAFERRIKGWTRAKKEALIAGDWERVSWLARAPTERPVRPERSAERAVEGRLAQPEEQRPSTALRTNDKADGTEKIGRPERSAERVVEGRSRP